MIQIIVTTYRTLVLLEFIHLFNLDFNELKLELLVVLKSRRYTLHHHCQRWWNVV